LKFFTEEKGKNKAELASVVQNFLPKFNKKNKLPAHKLRVLDAISKCRTSYMGGHIEACSSCGMMRTAFNSCRNRHCPKCGGIDKERWVLARENDLLPVRYFHVVFTVPDKLNALFLNNQTQMYNLLFRTSWQVLSDFGRTEKWIGGKIGATAILHSWGQNLHFHPHVHFIVPAGALMPLGKWKHSRQRGKFLFDVKQLSKVFRARFVEKLRMMLKEKTVTGHFPIDLFDKNWVVYAKKPFGNPETVIKYLGRYTHRTAISNKRIIRVDDESVRFSWHDYRKNYKRQETTLAGEEFLRLFCLHILPAGFTRIRHYGFLSSAAKVKGLAAIRKALRAKPPKPLLSKSELQEIALARAGIKAGVCKCCGGKMEIIEIIPNKFRKRQRAPPKLINKLEIVNTNAGF
jgi:hypothetical protein